MNNTKNDILETFKRGSMLTKLIYINVAVAIVSFIVFFILPKDSDSYLTVPGTFDQLIYQPWTLITYMFTHFEFMHLLMNMLWLFWFGRMFLQYFNEKQMLAVYLLGGFAGAFMHLGVNYLMKGAGVGIVGASAAVMSIVFAVVAFKPDYVMNLLFFGPVKIKYIAIIAFVLDVMGLAGNIKEGAGASDGIAHIAHMGGSLYGLWFGYTLRNGKDITRGFNNLLNVFFSWFTVSKTERKRSQMRATRGEKFSKPKSDWDYNKDKKGNTSEVDRILDKIKDKGYDSLTKKERDFLFKQKKK